MSRVRNWQTRAVPRAGERPRSPSPVETGLAARFLAPRAISKPVQRDLSAGGPKDVNTRFRAPQATRADGARGNRGPGR